MILRIFKVWRINKVQVSFGLIVVFGTGIIGIARATSTNGKQGCIGTSRDFLTNLPFSNAFVEWIKVARMIYLIGLAFIWAIENRNEELPGIGSVRNIRYHNGNGSRCHATIFGGGGEFYDMEFVGFKIEFTD